MFRRCAWKNGIVVHVRIRSYVHTSPLNKYLTWHMEQSYLLANISTANQISHVLWKPKNRHQLNKSPLPVRVPILMNSVHVLPWYFFRTCINVIRPSVHRSSKWYLSGFLTNIRYAFLFSHVLATCSGNRILLIWLSYSYSTQPLTEMGSTNISRGVKATSA